MIYCIRNLKAVIGDLNLGNRIFFAACAEEYKPPQFRVMALNVPNAER